MSTPTRTLIVKFGHDDIPKRCDFSDNLGQGTTIGVLTWGKVGEIGVDVANVTMQPNPF